MSKEPERKHSGTGRRDSLEGIGPERPGERCATAVRRVQGVLRCDTVGLPGRYKPIQGILR